MSPKSSSTANLAISSRGGRWSAEGLMLLLSVVQYGMITYTGWAQYLTPQLSLKIGVAILLQGGGGGE